MRRPLLIAVGAGVVVLLAAISTIAIAGARGGFDRHRDSFGADASPSRGCTVPNLPGTVVHVTLTNAGGPMFGGPMMGGGNARGGMMRLTVDTATVPHGSISFVATNAGSINHELLVLPLPDKQIVGTRSLLGDGRVDERASLGEASNSCGPGAGDGIAPGDSSWLTLSLAPGRYELICNLPGHYAAGMYTQLTVQ